MFSLSFLRTQPVSMGKRLRAGMMCALCIGVFNANVISLLLGRTEPAVNEVIPRSKS